MSNFNKIFNSVTITGRANVAKATYASFALLYIIHRLRKRSKAAAKCPDCSCQNCNDSSTAASAGIQSKGGVKEGTCDAETWKRVIDSGKTTTSAAESGVKKSSSISAAEVTQTKNSNSVEEVEARVVNADNQNAITDEPFIINEVWGCDL